MEQEGIIDPRTDIRFAIFSAQDRQFLACFCGKHPKIGQNFAFFLGLPPPLRVQAAKVRLMDIDRAGWKRRGIANPETVYDHVFGLAEYVGSVLREVNMALPDPMKRTGETMRLRLMQMAKLHDFPEAITADFTPHDKIAPEDKDRVERLAARVIFAAPGQEGNLALVEEFIDQQTGASHLLHDFDKIHAVRGALFYESKHPQHVGLCDEFMAYSAPHMKTALGQNMMKELIDNKEAALAELNVLHAKAAAGQGRSL